MKSASDEPSANQPLQPQPRESARVLSAEQLFGGEREVWIEHDGTRYRLRITRRNKLILQK